MPHHPDHEIELYRDDDAYVVYVDLPGYDESDVEVWWHDQRLSIAAERAGDDGRRSVYYRSLGLPREVEADRIDARYEDEVLEVTAPIADPMARPGREIPLD